MSSAAQLIVEARIAAHLTQSELARRARTSQAAIARYESGAASPSVATLDRVLRAAGQRLELSTTPAAIADLHTAQASAVRRHRKQVLELARSHGIRNVRLFGSVARGDARVDSDIDLLVDLDTDVVGLLPALRLGEALAELLGYRVDIAPADLLEPRVAQAALAEAVAL